MCTCSPFTPQGIFPFTHVYTAHYSMHQKQFGVQQLTQGHTDMQTGGFRHWNVIFPLAQLPHCSHHSGDAHAQHTMDSSINTTQTNQFTKSGNKLGRCSCVNIIHPVKIIPNAKLLPARQYQLTNCHSYYKVSQSMQKQIPWWIIILN